MTSIIRLSNNRFKFILFFLPAFQLSHIHTQSCEEESAIKAILVGAV